MFYAIIRIMFKGEVEAHSVEFRDNYDTALQRWFNIVAADLANQEVTYNAAYIIGSDGLMRRGEAFDRRSAAEEA